MFGYTQICQVWSILDKWPCSTDGVKYASAVICLFLGMPSAHRPNAKSHLNAEQHITRIRIIL